MQFFIKHHIIYLIFLNAPRVINKSLKLESVKPTLLSLQSQTSTVDI